jgi:hypothetical protein
MANQVITIFQFGQLCHDEDSSIAFLRDRRILHQNRECCGLPMRRAHKNNVAVWRCTMKGCKNPNGLRPGFFKYIFMYHIVKGTWINPSRLPFTTIVRFIYCWAEEITSCKFDKKHLNMHKNSTVDWSNYLREVCVKFNRQN